MWPVKIAPEITYNVLSGTLSLYTIHSTAMPFVHDYGRSFCAIFAKFGTQVTHVITKTKFDGQ